jgi:hypothetical protein
MLVQLLRFVGELFSPHSEIVSQLASRWCELFDLNSPDFDFFH